MKKVCVILFCFIFIVTIYGERDKNCLEKLKAKARSLMQYKTYKKAKKVKKVIAKIVKGLQECGFSEEETEPIREFQKVAELELSKKVPDKTYLPCIFYANSITGMLEALETKYAGPGRTEEKDEEKPETTVKPGGETGKKQDEGKPGTIVKPGEETEKKQDEKKPGTTAKPVEETEKKKDEEKPKPTDKPGKSSKKKTPPPKEKKIDTKFPAEEFDKSSGLKEDEKIAVLTAGELKTSVDSLEKRVVHLADTLNFYQYALIFIIIASFIMVSLTVLSMVLLRRRHRTIVDIERQMALLRREQREHRLHSEHSEYSEHREKGYSFRKK